MKEIEIIKIFFLFFKHDILYAIIPYRRQKLSRFFLSIDNDKIRETGESDRRIEKHWKRS